MTGMFFDENTEREILHRSTSKKPFDFSLKGGAWEPALPRKPIHLQRFDGDEVAEEDYEQSPSVIPAPKANPIMKSKVRQPKVLGSSSMGAGGNMGVEPYLARNVGAGCGCGGSHTPMSGGCSICSYKRRPRRPTKWQLLVKSVMMDNKSTMKDAIKHIKQNNLYHAD